MNNWFTNRKTGFVSVFHHNKSSFKKFCVAGLRTGVDWWLMLLTLLQTYLTTFITVSSRH